MKQEDHICHSCGNPFTRREVGIVYGKESPVYYGGYCSAACYTSYVTGSNTSKGDSEEYNHTKGKLQLSKSGEVLFQGCVSVGTTYGHSNSKPNAARIVHCWNEFDNVKADSVKWYNELQKEREANKELVEALKEVMPGAKSMGWSVGNKIEEILTKYTNK